MDHIKRRSAKSILLAVRRAARVIPNDLSITWDILQQIGGSQVSRGLETLPSFVNQHFLKSLKKASLLNPANLDKIGARPAGTRNSPPPHAVWEKHKDVALSLDPKGQGNAPARTDGLEMQGCF